MPRYAAAIFDLDGLLLDTERLAIAAGQEVLADLGWPGNDGLFQSLIGTDDATSSRKIAAHYGADFPLDDFGQGWNARFAAKLDAGIDLRPGAAKLLEVLGAAGLPCAVATSSRRHAAEKKLAISGLARYFATVVSVNCIAKPKPAPDPYLEAARRLGMNPAQCIAFEDSDTGAAAAQASGMIVVQVPDMLRTTGPHAHHLAPDLLTGARMAGLI
ncbi:MAG: HAD family phosphatase [Albidovulum sp.]